MQGEWSSMDRNRKGAYRNHTWPDETLQETVRKGVREEENSE